MAHVIIDYRAFFPWAAGMEYQLTLQQREVADLRLYIELQADAMHASELGRDIAQEAYRGEHALRLELDRRLRRHIALQWVAVGVLAAADAVLVGVVAAGR